MLLSQKAWEAGGQRPAIDVPWHLSAKVADGVLSQLMGAGGACCWMNERWKACLLPYAGSRSCSGAGTFLLLLAKNLMHTQNFKDKT